MMERTYLAHDLWQDGDKDIPSSITDRNGQVTLGLCKRCGQGEADLEYDCPGDKNAQRPTVELE